MGRGLAGMKARAPEMKRASAPREKRRAMPACLSVCGVVERLGMTLCSDWERAMVDDRSSESGLWPEEPIDRFQETARGSVHGRRAGLITLAGLHSSLGRHNWVASPE